MVKNIKLPGYRNIKTSIGVFICVLIYSWLGRDGTIFAVLSVIICMQDNSRKSVTEGIGRFLGTILGATFGTIFVFMNFDRFNFLIEYAFMTIGLVLLIHLSSLLNLKRSIGIGAVVYAVIVLGADSSPFMYSINRTIDTTIGIVIAVLLNKYFLKPKGDIMNYEEAISHIQSQNTFGMKLDLYRIETLMKHLGNPQDKLKFVHIAGTNGKGSTSSFCFHILKETGQKIGLFTSPYIQRFTERIRVNDEEIPEEEVAKITEKIVKVVNKYPKNEERPTWFEIVTAISFVYFYEQKCDIVVLEVGLGGNLDATNIIKESLVSIITAIGYDHMNVLGNTLEEIAEKKAGIIKKGGNAVVYPQAENILNVFRDKAEKENANLNIVNENNIERISYSLEGQTFNYKNMKNLEISLLGEYQVYNAVTAIEALEKIVSEEQIREGLKKTTWAGRMELLSKTPIFFLDGAHNTHGVLALAENLKTLLNLKKDEKIVFILGVLKTKDPTEMLRIIKDIADTIVCVTPNNDRAMSSEELKDLVNKEGIQSYKADSIEEAIGFARAKNLPICAFGSLYYIGAVRDYFGLK